VQQALEVIFQTPNRRLHPELPWHRISVMVSSMETDASPSAEMRAFLRRRDEDRRQKRDARYAEAVAQFDKIVEIIKAENGVRRIWQWGSLLHRERFSDISDIDIAVEGELPAGAFFKLLDAVQRVSTFPVDLVELDRLPSSTREWIVRKGRLIHER